MFKKVKIALSVFVALVFFSNAFAVELEKTLTGFYYPIGRADFNQASGGWLERDEEHNGDYFDGLYHIGVDMMTNSLSAGVYAIASGQVFFKHCDDSSWGSGNCALFIRHYRSSGDIFTGLYGHVRTSLKSGDQVYPGKKIGTTGPWSDGIHLHFAIRMGDSVSPSPWGRLPNSSWPNTNGFINPIDFIRTYTPGGDPNYFTKLPFRKVANVAWYPPNKSCVYAERWRLMDSTGNWMTIGNNGICYSESGKMSFELGDNAWEVIYGPNDINEMCSD